MITHDRLRELLSYDPETGVFRWLKDRTNRYGGCRIKAGSIAGNKRSDGYVLITVDMKRYYAHRLAWFYVYGEWPERNVDHINLDPSDNRIANLRDASQSENIANQTLPRHNTSGFKGVSWCKREKKWAARIQVMGRGKGLGHYNTPEEAAAAYDEAALTHFGQFARVN